MKSSATEFRESPRDRKLLLFAIVAVLLLISLSRIVRLSPPGIIDDETWSVWQTLGTPAQIVAWTPYDWPPLFYLMMGFWKGFVGIYPEADRFLSVLLILVGSAAMYRVARRVSSGLGWEQRQLVGLLAMLAFAGPGYSILISIYQRGYSVLLGLSPVLLWVVLRYFYRPTWLRAAWIAALIAIMFYIHYTAILFFAMVGVFTLIMYRQRIWLWWRAVVLGTPLVLPGILAHLALSRSYAQNTQGLNVALLPLVPAMRTMFNEVAGYSAVGWLALIIVAGIFLLYRLRLRAISVALTMWVLSPLAVFAARPLIGWFLTGRFLWWLFVGAAIWIAWGLALAPQRIRRIVVLAGSAIMIAAMFMPIPVIDQDNPAPALADYRFLKDHIQRYDVILIDPKCNTISPVEWDYFSKVYFPEGLQFVNNPTGYRRVWYVTAQNRDPQMAAQVAQDRLALDSVGPARLQFQLYEAPPDVAGIPFDNGMRFHGLDFEGTLLPGMVVYHLNEPFRVRLWWSLDKPLDHDYSVGLYVFLVRAGAGALAMQSDGPIYANAHQSGQLFTEERDLTVATTMQTATYPIQMAVYDPANSNARQSAPGVNQDKMLTIEQFSVKEWTAIPPPEHP